MSEAEEPVVKGFSKPLRLHWLLLWGLFPAIAMTGSGLCMEFRAPAGLDGLLLMVGLLCGPVILLVWSLRILWPTSMKTWGKVVLAIPITVAACSLNLFLAAGACATFDPPFMH